MIIPAAAVKRVLTARGWYQADLAAASGVATQTISSIASRANYHVAARVARKLGDAPQRQPVVLSFFERAVS